MEADIEREHARAVEELAASAARIFVVGGVDTGKTTFTNRLAHAALRAGQTVAIVDSDLGQSTIGPPGTVGLKLVREEANLEPGGLAHADVLSFVGAISPRGHFLPLVVGTARLVMRAIELGARLILLDTSGLIGGVAGQVLKLSKAELCRPHHVVALSHGDELEPIVGALQRFASVEVTRLRVHPEIVATSVDDRARHRESRLAEALGPAMSRWRVRPTIFLPSLPPDFDLATLDGLLVGVDNGAGDCLGLGVLEYSEDALRLLTPLREGVKALRLGSIRVTPEGRITGHVDIRSMFGTD